MMADWYQPLREVRSLGSQTAKPGSLGGLHAARKAHLGQFFTVDSLALFAWNLALPAMARALSRDGEGSRIALFDNSVGSGRLFQFADPTTHSLAGVDIHGPAVDRLSSVSEAAGFKCDFLRCGMEAVRARQYSVGLINPPFSLNLQSPLLEPYDRTTFGKYGPNSSAVSHAYALEQALDACDIVIAILPRSFARAVEDDPTLSARLAGAFDLPRSTFEEENADVAVTVLAFDRLPRDLKPVRASVSDLESEVPDLGLECRTETALHPRLRHKLVIDEGPVITLPVTGNTTVRVAHDGRKLVLKYHCGLTQAKVANAILRESVARYPHEDKRYPKQIRYTGDGALDLEVYLAQPDPLAAFQQFIELIRSAGGQPVVDVQVNQYLVRRARRNARDAVPLRHMIYAPAALDSGRIAAKANTTHALNPNSWLSPVIEAGEPVEFVPVKVNDETRYRLDFKAGTCVLTYEQLLQRYEIQDVQGDWIVKHEGLGVRYPDIAKSWIARAKALGIDKWLTWGFQFEDLIELSMKPRGAFCAWTMGLGKARCAIALALLSDCKHALIVVEPHLVPEMEREITSLPLTEADMEGELSTLGLDESLWQVIRSSDDLNHLKRINVISYNRLRLALDGSRPKLTFARRLRRRIGILIADEGHLLRNMNSQQTRAVWMVSARKRYILSGTPVANYPRDIAPLLAYIADGTAAQPYGYYRPYLEARFITSTAYALRGLDAFREHHVCTEWVTNEFKEDMQTGAKREVPKIVNLESYRRAIAPYMKRRVTSEPEVAQWVKIPKPIEETHTLAWDEGHLKYYLDVAFDFAEEYRKQADKASKRGIKLNLVALLARIRAVQFAANYPQHGITGFGAFTGLTSKQRFVLDTLEQWTLSGHKSILYAENPGLLQRLHQELEARGIPSLVFTGQEPIVRRTRELDRQFRFGDCPLMLASLGVTQTGLNIPQADRVMLYDRSWTAKQEDQAIHRILRPQQKRQPFVDYVHLDGSIDLYQAQMVSHKRDAAHAGLDYGTPELYDVEFLHLDTVLARFVDDLAALRNCSRTELRAMLKVA